VPGKLLACLCAALAAASTPVCAQDGVTLDGVSLEQMRARDQLGRPADELAAWQAFAAPVLADPAATPAVRAETRFGLATALLYAKQYAEGWAVLEEARGDLALIPAPARFASEFHATAAQLLTELGRLDEAEPEASSALALAQAGGEAALREQAMAHNTLAGIAFARGDLPGAEAGFCTARDLGLAAPDPYHAMIVNDASSCGVVKYYLERPDTLAAMRWASAYAYAHLPPDHPRMGSVLNGTYGVLMLYGRSGEAEPLIRRHLELERELHPGDADDVYDPLSMLARALELRGQLAESEALFRAAADMADRIANRSQPHTRGQARLNLARVIARQGRLDEAAVEARGGLERALAVLESGDSNIGNAQAQLAGHLERIGQAEAGLGLVDSGLAILEAALPAGHSEILGARLIRARILARLGRNAEAMTTARTAAEQFEKGLFDLAASETEQVSLSRVLPYAFGDYLEVALATGDMEQAAHGAQLLLLSELALTNARIAAASIARSEGLGEVVERLDAARGEVVRLTGELTAAQVAEGNGAGAVQTALAAAQTEAVLAQAALLVAFPDFVDLARPRLATLAQLQAGLEDGELLVLPVSLPGRTVTLAISRSSAEWGETPIDAYQLGELAARVRRSAERVDESGFDVAAAHRLFGAVFPDSLAPLLAANHSLLFPASGYLARLSPAVLLSAPADAANLRAAPYLARSHALRIVPDLAVLGARSALTAPERFLGVGAPSLTDADAAWFGLPPLPTASAELAALALALGAGENTLLTEAQATEAALAEHDLAAFRVIAFATHGLVGGEVAGLAEPALVMSTPLPGDAGDDGLLTASEIARLHLDADWVILTACNTAAGEQAGSPGYSGLARAFAQAGARSLMLSHWRVRDDAATFLSVETMRRAAAGVPRAEALREAQLALIARTDVPGAAHPAVWAPFVIVGN